MKENEVDFFFHQYHKSMKVFYPVCEQFDNFLDTVIYRHFARLQS